jgi:hypothetical protein
MACTQILLHHPRAHIICGRDGGGDGLLERIEVDDNKVNGGDIVLLEGSHVFCQFTAGEDAAMDLGMQRLDTACPVVDEGGFEGREEGGEEEGWVVM